MGCLRLGGLGIGGWGVSPLSVSGWRRSCCHDQGCQCRHANGRDQGTRADSRFPLFKDRRTRPSRRGAGEQSVDGAAWSVNERWGEFLVRGRANVFPFLWLRVDSGLIWGNFLSRREASRRCVLVEGSSRPRGEEWSRSRCGLRYRSLDLPIYGKCGPIVRSNVTSSRALRGVVNGYSRYCRCGRRHYSVRRRACAHQHANDRHVRCDKVLSSLLRLRRTIIGLFHLQAGSFDRGGEAQDDRRQNQGRVFHGRGPQREVASHRRASVDSRRYSNCHPRSKGRGRGCFQPIRHQRVVLSRGEKFHRSRGRVTEHGRSFNSKGVRRAS